MRRAFFALCSALALVASACGGPTHRESTVVSAPNGATGAPIVQDKGATRTASDEIRKRWPFGGNIDFALYADLKGLTRTPLFAGLFSALAQMETLDEKPSECVRDLVAAAKELAIGADGEKWVAILRFDEKIATPSACLAAANAKPTKWESTRIGHLEAYAFDKGTIAIHEPGMLVIGTQNAITPSPSPFPSSLALLPGQHVIWNARLPEEVPGGGIIHGSLLVADERFRLDAEADLHEELAKRIEEPIASQIAAASGALGARGASEADLVKRLSQAITVNRSGGHLSFAFELREPLTQQARDLGAAAALSISAVRRYIAQSKVAEAKNTVGQIAKSYLAYWETESGHPGAKKKLFALPPVPKAVPQGVKYQSTETDWKPWERLRFSMEMPQYFQYEVRVAKDGWSGEILARGDLNGDGKTSLVRVKMKVDRKTNGLVIDPHIEETDPME